MVIIIVREDSKGGHFAVRKRNDFNINPDGIVFRLTQKEGEQDKAFERRIMKEANRRHIFYVKGLSQKWEQGYEMRMRGNNRHKRER